METINENSSCFLDVKFYDEYGDPVTPTAVEYRIDDLHSGQVVTEDGSSSPAEGACRITITPAENEIINTSRESEVRIVTIAFTYGDNGSKQGTNEVRYMLKNLLKRKYMKVMRSMRFLYDIEGS